jgi:TonB family protein
MLVYVLLLAAAMPVKPVSAELLKSPDVSTRCNKIDCSFDKTAPTTSPSDKSDDGYRCIDGTTAPHKTLCGPVAVPEEKQYEPRPPIPTKATRPIPRGNPGYWMGPNDYPARSLVDEEEGVTSFRLTVGVDGKVRDCSITASSGFALLDAATCQNITRRARFVPAFDDVGNPTTGSYSNRVSWRIPASPSFAEQIDFVPSGPQATFGARIDIDESDYPLEALEMGLKGHANVVLSISEKGIVTNCRVKTGTGSPVLDIRTCEIATAWTFLPARDVDGKAIAGETSHDFAWMLPDAWKAYQRTGLYPPKSVN